MLGERARNDTESVDSSSAFRSAPDLLSALRLVLGPAFVWALQNDPERSFYVALLAAVTDFVDGRLARRLRSESRRGAVLDVLADAVFVLCGLFALAASGFVAWLLPIAAALALAAMARAWLRGPGRSTTGERGLADLAGHAAGIFNYGVVLVVSGQLLLGAPTAWVLPASYAVAFLNLAPILLRWIMVGGAASAAASLEGSQSQAQGARREGRSRLRAWLRALLLVVLCVVASLVAAEIVLRMAASSIRESTRADSGPQLDDRVDIAVYGDSTPYGLGADTNFPEEIAERTGLDVVNRSRPGINSTQVARILAEDLHSYAPPIILVMAGVNDGWNLEDVPTDLLGPAARWYQSLPKLRVLRLLAIWWELGSGSSAYDRAKVRGWDDREETARLLGNDGLRRILQHGLGSIREQASANGARLLFIGYQAEGWNHVADLAEDVLRTDDGGNFLSTRAEFLGDGASMIQEDHFHPTSAGQKRIADLVVAELERRGWISAAGVAPR